MLKEMKSVHISTRIFAVPLGYSFVEFLFYCQFIRKREGDFAHPCTGKSEKRKKSLVCCAPSARFEGSLVRLSGEGGFLILPRKK